MNDELTPFNDPRSYVGYDLCGFPYNLKYPPNTEKYGTSHEGYSNKARGVLFYDFAVMGYDAKIVYKGKSYYLLNDGEACLSDRTFSERIETFESPISLIEHLKIEGIPLIELLDELEDAEPV
jgi:hypothetical protein